MTKIIFLSANPVDQDRLEVIKEFKEIDSVTGSAKYGNEIEVEQAHEVSLKELQNLLLKFRPRIVHFSGHGSKKGKLGFQNSSTNKAEMAPIEAIGNLFKIANEDGNIRCVVLNACHAKDQAKEISKYVDCVIGTPGSISDNEAFAFDEGFYNALANAESIETAIALGRNTLERKKLPTDIIEQLVRKGVDPSRVYLIDDSELFSKAQEYGLDFLPLNYFEKNLDLQKELKNWKEGLLSFSIYSIKKGLEYRRRILDVDKRGSDSIKTRLEKNGCIMLAGESGYSKTTILMELICDYFNRDYKVLYNVEAISISDKIRNEKELLDFLEDMLRKGHKLLVAVDNAHDERSAGIFYVIQKMRDEGDIELKKNIRFIVAARLPDLDWFIEDRLGRIDESVRKAIENSSEYRYEIPPLEEHEIKDFIARYSANKDDLQHLDARAKTIHAETKGHPLLVKFFVFGKGLEEDVKNRYFRYLKKEEAPANQECELNIMKTMLACALLDISEFTITDKVLDYLGIKEYALNLHQKTLYRRSESSWKTIHPRWCMELFSFLYNKQTILALVDKRIRYLREALELLAIRDEIVIYHITLTMYKLATLKKAPIDIVESVITLPDYLSQGTKCDIYALVMASTYLKLGMYNKTIDKCNEAIEINPNYASAWGNKGAALVNLGSYEEAIKCFDKAIEINPNDAKAWNNKGFALYDLGKHEEAISCYDKALEIKPDHANAWNNKGLALDSLGKNEEAIKYYDKAIELNPNFAYPWNNKGLALSNLGKYEEALVYHDKAIEIEPNYADALDNKGLALSNLGKYEEALVYYDKALELNPNHANAWNNKGNVLGNLGKHEEAIKCFDKAIELNPNFAYPWNNKGLALYDLGKHEEAIACYDKGIEIEPNDAKAWNNKGAALDNLRKYEEAIACYDKALDINPNYAKALFDKGNALFNLGKHEEAIECYDKALAINPNHAKAWYNKGNSLFYLGRYEEAIKCYDKAIEIDQNYATAWYNKGNTLYNLGKYEEAIKCYDKVIELMPNHAEAWYYKGLAFGILGKLEEAIKCYDKVIELMPNHAEAWYYKGGTLSNLKKYGEAIQCYDKAIEINPNHAEAWYYKGFALDSLGRYEEAIECYDKALEINPNDANALYNRACSKVKQGNIENGLADLKKAIEIDKKYIELSKQDKDFESIRNDERFKALVMK